MARTVAVALLAALGSACSSSHGESVSDAGPDSGSVLDDGGAGDDDAGHPLPIDGGYLVGDGGAVVSADRFVTDVVAFTRTACTGWGASQMPTIVEGPPVGAGTARGSLDVVSLGSGGSIVVSFAPNAIVDGPGPDFIVFENPFWIAGDPNQIYAEPGEISVSDDGTTWTTFACSPASDPGAKDGTGVAPPYGACAGWHVVYSDPQNGVSPLDPAVAGGDAFDLADVGVKHARFVRIVDKTAEVCPDASTASDKNGFDLDAVAIVNAEMP